MPEAVDEHLAQMIVAVHADVPGRHVERREALQLADDPVAVVDRRDQSFSNRRRQPWQTGCRQRKHVAGVLHHPRCHCLPLGRRSRHRGKLREFGAGTERTVHLTRGPPERRDDVQDRGAGRSGETALAQECDESIPAARVARGERMDGGNRGRCGWPAARGVFEPTIQPGRGGPRRLLREKFPQFHLRLDARVASPQQFHRVCLVCDVHEQRRVRSVAAERRHGDRTGGRRQSGRGMADERALLAVRYAAGESRAHQPARKCRRRGCVGAGAAIRSRRVSGAVARCCVYIDEGQCGVSIRERDGVVDDDAVEGHALVREPAGVWQPGGDLGGARHGETSSRR